jgi:hypothetical protein
MKKKRKATKTEWAMLFICYILGIMIIVILNNSIFISKSVFDDKDTIITGKYFDKSKTIAVFPDRATWFDSDDAYYHEKCHYYWDTKMNASQQEDYNVLFNASTTWVSWYARTEVGEDFAETCMYYLMKQDYVIDKDRLEYLNNIGILRR